MDEKLRSQTLPLAALRAGSVEPEDPTLVLGTSMGIMATSAPPTRNASNSSLSGSFIGSVLVASKLHQHRGSLALHTPSPLTELKLSRTRRLSIAGPQTSKWKRLARIPTQAEDLTSEWVRLIVNQFLIKTHLQPLGEGEKIIEFETKDCKTSCGDFSATIAISIRALALERRLGRSQLRFVAKLLPSDDVPRSYVFEANLMQKEIEMYFEVFPSLHLFLKARHQEELLGEVLPDCVYSAHNMDGAGVLVFRAATDLGFEACSKPEGPGKEDLSSAIDVLARFHAVCHAFLVTNGKERVERRYPFLTNDMYSKGLLAREIERRLDIYDDLLDSLGHSHFSDARVNLGILRKRIYCNENSENFDNNQLKSKWLTISHGEVWEKNILWRPRDRACVLLDWKNARIASGTSDIAFLVYSSTTYEYRQNGLDDLLRRYYTTFCSALNGLLPHSEPGDFESLKAEFNSCLKETLLRVVCMLVMEMEYLEQNVLNETENCGQVPQNLAENLQKYELRAARLLVGVDLDDENNNDMDNQEDSADKSEPQLLL